MNHSKSSGLSPFEDGLSVATTKWSNTERSDGKNQVMRAYANHQFLVEPAAPHSGLIRLVIGIVLIEAIYAAALQIIDALLSNAPDRIGDSYYYGDTTVGLLLQLSSFGLLIAATIIVALWGHGRGALSLIGPIQTFQRDLIRSFLFVLAFMLAMEALPPWWDTSEIDHLRPIPQWLLLLLPALLALIIQTGAEELLYRGYIQSQLAARFPYPLVWLTIPSLLFAAVHWDNGSTFTESAQYSLWAFFFGLAAADLTARTGSIGAALGLHLANNAFAFLFFAEVEGPDSGLALVLFTPGALAGSETLPGSAFFSMPFIIELCGVGLMWLAARFAIRR